MDTIRVGLIGCGVIGRWHAQAARETAGVELVAVADLIADRADAYAREFGVKETYGQGDELIDRAAVDLVVLALPACGRTALGLHAFAAGRHLLTEKPVAMNAAEVATLIAARGKLQAACCSSRFRARPSAQAATECLASGRLGDLRVVRARAIVPAGMPPQSAPPEWRLKAALNGGGILMNWGCYDLDYLLGLTGWTLRPRTVLAQTWPVTPQFTSYVAPGSEAETHLTALIRCEDGVVITYERGEYVSSRGEGAWTIIGTQGALHLALAPGNGKTIELDEGVEGSGVSTTVLWSGDEPWGGVDPCVGDLARAIREGGEPATTLEKALLIQQVSDAIYRSAATGAAVEVG